MATTSHLNLALVEVSQAQKEVTVNEALKRIDAVLNTGAIDKDLTTPPASPAEGDVYIVAASATDDWSGHDGEVAYFEQVWRFISPKEGVTLWLNDEDTLYSYDGSAWNISGGGVPSTLQNMTAIGVNSTADATNKLSVSSSAVLMNHDGDDVRLTLNKNSDTDTASCVFQSNWSGRAEFGLTGADDFTFKVSPDGSTFHESFQLDRNNGRLTVKKMFGFGDPEMLTMSSGEVTVSQSFIKVDTEAAAASDTLYTINGGTTGDILLLKTANDAREVVLHDRTTGSPATANLDLSGNFTLNRVRDSVMLMKDGTRWHLLSEQSN